MVEDLVRIFDRNRIFKFSSLEPIAIAPAASFDGRIDPYSSRQAVRGALGEHVSGSVILWVGLYSAFPMPIWSIP